VLNKETREIARKFALKNALDYGKADAGAVLNKVLASDQKLRENIKEVAALVKEVVDEVNKTSKDKITKEFELHAKAFETMEIEKRENRAKPKMELEGAMVEKFATRFPPEPNGYLQLGHAKIVWLEREFADAYKGTVALYFDDTNPEKEKQEYVDEIKRDLEWLGLRFEREYYASDHLEKIYAYAEKLVGQGNAYVCTCESEKIKKMRFEGRECEHRGQTEAENAKKIKGMLGGEFKDGEAALRIKLDMKAENTTMRDPVILRIIRHEHYRQGKKYIVWPTYDFNTPIVDSIEGITDAIRSKEYELRNELDLKILGFLGLRKPTIRSIARLEIKDNITSKRKTNALIEKGKLWGYDDPRLITIAGLRRRGVQPQLRRDRDATR
jgi:glutamyl-tRNA synthetase